MTLTALAVFKAKNIIIIYKLKMSSSIWNLKHPLRSGHIQLATGGKELFGTVIRDRRMRKTCTVNILLLFLCRCGYQDSSTIRSMESGIKMERNFIVTMKKSIAELEIKL